jgi:hypothetical protein
MNAVYDTVVVLHLLGMAAILGGVGTELVARRQVMPIMALHGAALQVVTGVALVGMASSELVAADVNTVKAAVKLTVAIAVLVLAFLARRRVPLGRVAVPAVGLLALGNVLVAVYG